MSSGDIDKDKKGFSGLADLVSDDSGIDEIVGSKPVSEAKPSSPNQASTSSMKTGLHTEPNQKVVTSPPLLGGILSWKWTLGIIAVAFLIALIHNGMESNKKTSYNPPPPAPRSSDNRPTRSTLVRKIENEKTRAKQMEIQIEDMDDRLEDYKRRMSFFRISDMTEEYNMLVPSFNLLISERNDLFEEYSHLVDEVNSNVKRYNSKYR